MRAFLLFLLCAPACTHPDVRPACRVPPGHGWSAGLMPDDEAHRAHASAANVHMHRGDFAQLVARFEDPTRDAWQRPAELVAAIAPQGKVVADLGAGTGYLTVRLAETASRVIATDVDERLLAYLRGRLSTMPALKDKVVLRLVGPERPGLVPEEVDVAVVVDVYHHVEERVDWLRALAAGLKPGGEIVVVDFKPGDFPDAPPPALRVPIATVVQELTAAGFEAPRVDESLLPRQFVARAHVAASP